MTNTILHISLPGLGQSQQIENERENRINKYTLIKRKTSNGDGKKEGGRNRI